MKARIILKNGNEINFECESITTTQNKLTNELVGIKYEGANIDINYLNLNEVVALTCQRNNLK